jgi:hypothetical protein
MSESNEIAEALRAIAQAIASKQQPRGTDIASWPSDVMLYHGPEGTHYRPKVLEISYEEAARRKLIDPG